VPGILAEDFEHGSHRGPGGVGASGEGVCECSPNAEVVVGGEPKQELPIPLGLVQAKQRARLSDIGLLVSCQKVGVDHSRDFVGESREDRGGKVDVLRRPCRCTGG